MWLHILKNLKHLLKREHKALKRPLAELVNGTISSQFIQKMYLYHGILSHNCLQTMTLLWSSKYSNRGGLIKVNSETAKI